MFSGFATSVDWSTVGTNLLNAGTGLIQAEAQKKVAASQASLVSAQQGLITAQAELEKAKTAQAGFGAFDMGKMAPVLMLGIGVVLFMTFKGGSQRPRSRRR
jgi:hypothetical protein